MDHDQQIEEMRRSFAETQKKEKALQRDREVKLQATLNDIHAKISRRDEKIAKQKEVIEKLSREREFLVKEVKTLASAAGKRKDFVATVNEKGELCTTVNEQGELRTAVKVEPYSQDRVSRLEAELKKLRQQMIHSEERRKQELHRQVGK